MDRSTGQIFGDRQLMKLSLLKSAIILCKCSRQMEDRDLTFKAEQFIRQNFGIPCAVVEATDPQVVGQILSWLSNAPQN